MIRKRMWSRVLRSHRIRLKEKLSLMIRRNALKLERGAKEVSQIDENRMKLPDLNRIMLNVNIQLFKGQEVEKNKNKLLTVRKMITKGVLTGLRRKVTRPIIPELDQRPIKERKVQVIKILCRNMSMLLSLIISKNQ